MVNPGGPSKGCITCIQRKIRCDRQIPICGQCAKSKRQCKGYRNPIDTMVRDQSKAIPHVPGHEPVKYPANITLPSPIDPINSATGNNIPRTEEDEGEAATLVYSPKLSQGNGLITFFINNFTCDSFRPGNNLFWIPSNFDRLLEENCLKLSVECVGAVALARLKRSAYYHREAQKLYGAALLSLGDMWQLEPELDTDSVLLTVLFLAFFEVLASYEPSSVGSWITHLEALGNLLKKRDEDFVNTDLGTRMLLTSRGQAIWLSLASKKCIGSAFQILSFRCPPSMALPVLQVENTDKLLIRLAGLQERFQSAGASAVLLAESSALYDGLRRWCVAASQFMPFSSQQTQNTSGVWWESRLDIYPTLLVGHVWNKIRVARVLTYDLIKDITDQLCSIERVGPAQAVRSKFDPMDPELQQAVLELCATIPIFYRPSSALAGPDMDLNRPPLGITYWFLYPVEVVGSMREAPPELQNWTLQLMDRVYETTGIIKAQIFGNRLRTKLGIPLNV